MRSTTPERFRQSDRALIYLLADVSDPAFSPEMDSLAEAYRNAAAFHPDISLAIAEYYGKIGEQDKREVFLRDITDRAGFGEQRATRDACVKLGSDLLRSGKTEEGRS